MTLFIYWNIEKVNFRFHFLKCAIECATRCATEWATDLFGTRWHFCFFYISILFLFLYRLFLIFLIYLIIEKHNIRCFFMKCATEWATELCGTWWHFFKLNSNNNKNNNDDDDDDNNNNNDDDNNKEDSNNNDNCDNDNDNADNDNNDSGRCSGSKKSKKSTLKSQYSHCNVFQLREIQWWCLNFSATLGQLRLKFDAKFVLILSPCISLLTNSKAWTWTT